MNKAVTPPRCCSPIPIYAGLGFRVYGREPRALKLGDRYLDEDLMILDLLPS